jgi:hypothetical protein
MSMRQVVAGSVCLLLGSCLVNLDLPEDAQVSCSAEAECPDGYTCNTTRGLCIPDDIDDVLGPQVVSTTAPVPTVGNDDLPFTLSFTVDEALGRAPRVWLTSFGVDEPLTVTSDGELTFVATYQASPDDEPGVHPLRVELEDLVGNVTQGPLGESLTFDFLAPHPVDGASTVAYLPNLLDPAYPKNPLLVIHGATLGTDVRVDVVTDEATTTASLAALDGDTAVPGLVFTWTSLPGFNATFFLDKEASTLVGGTFTLAVTLRDAAGNQATTAVGELVVDILEPTPPSVTTQDAVIFHRTPWGDGESSTEAYTLTGAAGAAPGLATVIVYGDALGRFEIARTETLADGSFGGASGLELFTVDRARVYLVTVDAAGNKSPVVPVHDIVWTATLGNKVDGSTLENPHTFELRTLFTDRLKEENQTFGGVELGVSLENDGEGIATSGEPTWRQERLNAQITPPPRRGGPSVVYDEWRRRLLMIYGFRSDDNSTPTSRTDVWTRAGGRWRQLPVGDGELDGSPTHLMGDQLAVFDTLRGEVIFAPNDTGVTWFWGATSFRRQNPPIGAPTPPSSTVRALAYDTLRGRALLFVAGGGPVEVWSYEGAAWKPFCTGACASTAPTASLGMAAVYDELDDEVVVVADGETHTLSGQTWAERCSGSCAGPVSRAEFAMTYDKSRDRMVLYGGCTTISGLNTCYWQYFDVWEWDGSQWSCNRPPYYCAGELNCPASDYFPVCNSYVDTGFWDDAIGDELPVPPDEPHNGAAPGLVFDEDRQRVMLVGGQDRRGLQAGYPDWEWDGADWTRVPTNQSDLPAYAFDPLFMYHPGADRLGLFDGQMSNDFAWIREGNTWALACPTLDCPLPPSRGDAAVAYDPVAEKVVFFGGSPGRADTWTWDPRDTPSFVQRCTAQPCSSSPTAGPAVAAYASGLDIGAGAPVDGVLLVGARSGPAAPHNEVWLWRANDWQRLCTTSPCADDGPELDKLGAFAWDNVHSRAVLYGGVRNEGPYAYSQGDTWFFDGTSWEAGPLGPDRSDFAAVTDPLSGRVMAYGGRNGLQSYTGPYCGPNHVNMCDTLLTLEDEGWSPATVRAVNLDSFPLARSAYGMAFDSMRHELLIFGGEWETVPPFPQPGFGMAFADLWALDLGVSPGHVFGASFEAAHAASTAQIRTVEVHWRAGASSGALAASVSGARLLVWGRHGWIETDAGNTAPAALPNVIDWASDSDPSFAELSSPELAALQADRSRSFYFAVTPRSAGGAVASDFVSVTVRYQEP